MDTQNNNIFEFKERISQSEFERVRSMIYSYCGIHINTRKQVLVQSRLSKRMRQLSISTFNEYLDLVNSEKPRGEFLSFVDVLTTNKTSFYRENRHFEFIKNVLYPEMKGRSVKWWSAGCSSGEEPITLAMNLLEAQHQFGWLNVKILATDISREVLSIAKSGIYTSHKISDIPPQYLRKYFTQLPDNIYQVNANVKNLITFGRLNLKNHWPLKGNFQMIMCRNVMIYFNRKTQELIVDKFRELLELGGYLFLGHSESINAARLGFKNIAPAVYQKT